MTFPNEPDSRIAPLSTDDLRAEWMEILGRIPGKGLQGEGFPRNVLGVLMQNQETLGPFLDYWVTSKSKMGLTIREQELVILRMAASMSGSTISKSGASSASTTRSSTPFGRVPTPPSRRKGSAPSSNSPTPS